MSSRINESSRTHARNLVWLAVSVAAAGCASEADRLAQAGADALEECDIRAAHAKFAEAHRVDPNHPEAAIGFAFTDLALLPEDPAVTAVLMDLGFTGPLDMHELAFGPDSVFARAARGESCEQLEAFGDAQVPYPPVADSSIDPRSLIRADMVYTDILDGIVALSPRLERIATALDTAARGLDSAVEFEGGCGLGKLTIQAVDMHAIAAIVTAVRAGALAALAYDWDIPVRDLSTRTTPEVELVVATLNEHLGRLVSTDTLPEAREVLREALSHARAAFEAIPAARGAVEDPAFDWAVLTPAHIASLESWIEFAEQALDGLAAMPEVVPALSGDLSPLFAGAIDFAQVAPMFFVEDFGDGFATIRVDETVLGSVLDPLLSPAPWDENAPFYEWTGETLWRTLELDIGYDSLTDHYNAVQCALDE